MDIKPKVSRKQLNEALQDFYNKPIAKVSFELFLTIGAVLFFAIFAIRPTLLTMADLVKEIEDKRELDRQLQQKIASLSSAQSTYLQLEPRLSVLDESIPNSPRAVEALKILEKIASDQQLVISNLNMNEIPEETTAEFSEDAERETIPIRVSVTGNYAAIKNYIEAILQLRRAFIIDTITFTKTEEQGTEVLSASITFGLPYFAE